MKKLIILMFLISLSGCSTLSKSINNEVGGLFFPIGGGPDDDYYEYVGYDEDSGYDLFELIDRYEYKYNHKALLVSLSEGRSSDARDIIKTLSKQEYLELLQVYAAKEAAIKAERERQEKARAAEQERQRQIRLAEQERQRQIRLAEQERQRQIRLAEQERQRQIRLAEQERQRQIRHAKEIQAEKARIAKIMSMRPVACNDMITALNENEVRAIRQYPLDNEYRVIGIASDINVTFGVAKVLIKSDVDFFNGCSAEMKSFDDAEIINKGDKIDLFCSSWRETAGNVIFKQCRPYSQMLSR
jgi:hypothetical protein